MPTSAAHLARMLAFDGLTATFGGVSGPCQKDVGLVAEEFVGRSEENHAKVLTGITSVLVSTDKFKHVRIGDLGTVGGCPVKVNDRETKNDGALLRLYLEAS